jgi:hypothetical protein
MKTLVAALAIALSLVVAHAQSNPSLGTSRNQRIGYQEMKPRYQKKMDDELYKVKDKSYEDALKSIPDSKKDPDPWANAR